ncbi:hypothetical protein H0H93_004187 [Arthromyces matolae]|nr:hypothetical protein H0H93_004187 [Arthromyces matolae]
MLLPYKVLLLSASSGPSASPIVPVERSLLLITSMLGRVMACRLAQIITRLSPLRVMRAAAAPPSLSLDLVEGEGCFVGVGSKDVYIYPPPEPLLRSPPSLPSPARNPAFNAPYTLSTHIFPAAYLRTTEYVKAPESAPANGTKAERRAYADNALQQLKDLRGSLTPRGTKQILWNCANRYVRNGLVDGKPGGVTLFFAHANGFPKEIWEPMLGHLLSSPEASVIDEVWTWESVQHGDACLINGEKNGGSLPQYFQPTFLASHQMNHLIDRTIHFVIVH